MARSLRHYAFRLSPLLPLLFAGACGSSGETVAASPPASAGGDAAVDPATDGRTTAPTATDAGTTPPADPCALVPLRKVLWGDLHVHTSYSLDSYVIGNPSDPVNAYAFAQKKADIPIGGNVSNKVTIDRPLDFTVITDHSEWLDVTEECTLDPASPNYNSNYCTSLRTNGATSAAFLSRTAQLLRPDPVEPAFCDGVMGNTQCVAARKSAWQRLQAAAKSATQSDCSFTGLIGYEWTAQTNGDNLHRNVVFGTETVPPAALDYIHYPTVQSLWNGLDAQCTGACKALVIPHNTNASNGQMWNTSSDPANYAQMQKYQRLVEIYQHKGNSECFPDTTNLSDVACGFEAAGNFVGGTGEPDEAARKGYVREGLGRGLELVHAGDATKNPLALGFVGGTDTHNGAPGYVGEGTEAGPKWQGHLSTTDDSPAERINDNAKFSPGGITAVWARNNTRAEIFSSLYKRETYATSGPRMTVRFYAKTGIASQAAANAFCADSAFPAKLEAAGGVPMGSELATAGSDTWLFVMAAKDTTDLAAIDLVELRTDAAGKATMTRDLVPLAAGTALTCIARKMPALAAGSRGLAYARVFEDETWRWSHYDCADPTVSGTAACNPATLPANGGVNVKIQERAWTSPIFLR